MGYRTFRFIDAPATVADAVIADYRDGHPHIPRPPFVTFAVEAGGRMARVTIATDMRVRAGRPGGSSGAFSPGCAARYSSGKSSNWERSAGSGQTAVERPACRIRRSGR